MKIPLWETIEEQLLADLETPVSAFLKLENVGAIALLETVERGAVLGRYSFIGVKPLIELISDQGQWIAKTGNETLIIPFADDPTRFLDELILKLRPHPAPVPGNLLGGAFGYLSYEYIQFIEKVPVKPEDSRQPPLARFVIPRSLVTFDHLTRRMFVRTIRPTGSMEDHGEEPTYAGWKLLEAAAAQVQIAPETELNSILDALRGPLPLAAPRSRRSFAPTASPDPHQYETWVERAKQYIRAGDIFQVVLSQSLRGELSTDPFELYRALRALNPSPYLFYLDFSPTVLVGSSPEVLVKLEGDVATVRPIAGTRPRGATPKEDRALADELLHDEKECAEHVMLVDLGRNDLGRVSEYGTVEVTDYKSIERYSHVMHMVSYVRGRLQRDLNRIDLLRAVFPAGTVSGAPKIRAMEIIDEFELRRRGPYSGAVGYFAPNGEMDLCIAIRTMICHGEELTLQAGAGIVADSDPHAEHVECRRKMQGLIAAIELAEEGLR